MIIYDDDTDAERWKAGGRDRGVDAAWIRERVESAGAWCGGMKALWW